MNREQLAHVLRAAARIADDDQILVLGSQAILGGLVDLTILLERVDALPVPGAVRRRVSDRVRRCCAT